MYASASNAYNSTDGAVVDVQLAGVSPPTAPRQLVLSNLTGGFVSVSWLVPTDEGGTAVTDYDTELLLMSSGVVIQTASRVRNGLWGNVSFGWLGELTSYVVRVTAVNTAACAAPGDQANITLVTGPASLPRRQLPPLLRCGASSVNVTWLAPRDEGGIYVLLYVVYGCGADVNGLNAGCQPLANVSAPGSGAPVGGSFVWLARAATTSYALRILPVNAVGAGESSAYASCSTEVAVAPTSPLGLIRSSATGGALVLSWDPPLDFGGAPIDYYECSVLVSVWHHFANASATVRSCSVAGLTASTSYGVRVTAVTAGPRGAPVESLVSTTAATAPEAPPVSATRGEGVAQGILTVLAGTSCAASS